MDGLTSFTVMVTVAVPVPPELVALTIYDAVLLITVGMPLIWPVLVLNTNPVGNGLLMEYDTTAPPVLDGLNVVIPEPLVATTVFGE